MPLPPEAKRPAPSAVGKANCCACEEATNRQQTAVPIIRDKYFLSAIKDSVEIAGTSNCLDIISKMVRV